MKMITARIFSLLLLFQVLNPGTVYSIPKVNAPSAILLDGKTGEVIYEKNAHEQRPPASTTKILTALLAIECGDLDTVVQVSSNAASVGEASINLAPGDKLKLEELLHGALMKSGNDACVAISETIAPSEEEFVGLMNLKAKILGAENTNFCNTNGLPHRDHLTTAYDLAVITKYALDNSIFSQIVGKKFYTMDWEEPSKKKQLKNTNQLLWTYSWATGVKTGTTVKAGKCLVASAENNGNEMIVVVLHSSDRFGDARRLLEYGFEKKENSYAKR